VKRNFFFIFLFALKSFFVQSQSLELDTTGAFSVQMPEGEPYFEFSDRYEILGPSLSYATPIFNRHYSNESSYPLLVYLHQKGLSSEDKVMLDGQEITLERSSAPHLIKLPSLGEISINDQPPLNNSKLGLTGAIGLVNRTYRFKQQDFGDAGDCQVNAACPEGLFPDLEDATVRILWFNSGVAGWCSGTLMNNTAYDLRPLILTAEHCALIRGEPSEADYRNWTFFFNYQSAACETPRNDLGLDAKNRVGARVLSRSNDNGGDTGSDFLLIELINSIPDHFEAYYAGWNRSSTPPLQGECYHHPAGDLMKISTYRSSASLGSFGGVTDDTHYQVQWVGTPNGFGTTEPGSSGSALLDENGLVVGQLTGGASSCEDPRFFDLYGTMSYNWNKNGSATENQLGPWLDPLNSGVVALSGTREAQTPVLNAADNWQIKTNPVRSNVLELSGINNLSQLVEIGLFNINGQLIWFKEQAPISGQAFMVPIPNNVLNGFYFLRLQQADRTKTFKLWVLRD
jgi:hypothetical protein